MRHDFQRNLDQFQHTLERLLAKNHRTPSPENIHKIRVTIRRIRTALYLAEHANDRLSFRKLDKHLKLFCKELTEARELDVAIQNSHTFHVTIPHLRSRVRQVSHLHLSLGQKEQRIIIHELNKTIHRIKQAPVFKLKRSLKDLRKELKPWLYHSISTQEDLHRFRLNMKRTRYSLELINRPAKKLVQLQDYLGQARDLAWLQKLTGRNKRLKKQEMLEIDKAKKIAKVSILSSLEHLSFSKSHRL